MPPNWVNRTLWTGDNLNILRGMNSESVDLIYLDPPFNSNRDYEAPIGSKAAGGTTPDPQFTKQEAVADGGERRTLRGVDRRLDDSTANTYSHHVQLQAFRQT